MLSKVFTAAILYAMFGLSEAGFVNKGCSNGARSKQKCDDSSNNIQNPLNSLSNPYGQAFNQNQLVSNGFQVNPLNSFANNPLSNVFGIQQPQQNILQPQAQIIAPSFQQSIQSVLQPSMPIQQQLQPTASLFYPTQQTQQSFSSPILPAANAATAVVSQATTYGGGLSNAQGTVDSVVKGQDLTVYGQAGQDVVATAGPTIGLGSSSTLGNAAKITTIGSTVTAIGANGVNGANAKAMGSDAISIAGSSTLGNPGTPAAIAGGGIAKGGDGILNAGNGTGIGGNASTIQGVGTIASNPLAANTINQIPGFMNAATSALNLSSALPVTNPPFSLLPSTNCKQFRC